jgi:alkylhydroperoxidase/carboxymuconolactone decarboxylase family protein YurZ
MADQASDTPVLDLLARMTADSMVSAGLDAQSLMVARIAALVAVGAPTASYPMNLAAAEAADLDPEQVRGVLAAVAPIVGTARVVDAAGNIMEAFGIAIAAAIEAAELEAEASDTPER